MSEIYLTKRELEILSHAEGLGMLKVLTDYAKQIQRELSAEGDEAFWIDCLEMAYNELIVNTL